VLNFATKYDSRISLNQLLNQVEIETNNQYLCELESSVLYKVFVLANMYYPTELEIEPAIQEIVLDVNKWRALLKRAIENIENRMINFLDPKVGLFDLTESLYVSHSSGRTKVSRMLYRSNNSRLRGFIWNHDSASISIIESSDPRNYAAMNLDRSAFGSTATGTRFTLKSNLFSHLVMFLNRHPILLNFAGKRHFPKTYNLIIQGFLGLSRMRIIEPKESFNSVFYNQILMTDYAEWNRETISRIKTLVKNSEVSLYFMLHDDIVYRIPTYFPERRVAEFQYVLDLAKVAEAIFVPSQSELRNIARHFDNPTKISVIPLSGNHILEFQHTLPKLESMKYPTFLHFLGDDPRKNSIRVLRALLDVAKQGKFFSLNIVGGEPAAGSILESLFSELASLGVNTSFFKNLSEEGLANVYRSSGCLIYCSIAEGFGLPIAEAAEIGCSVITSNTGSTLEVGKKYQDVVFVNPKDIQEIANSLAEFVEKPTVPSLRENSKRTWNDVLQEILLIMGRADS